LLRALDAVCFGNNVAGLREAGWAGDERVVRLRFTAAAALRYSVGTLPFELSMVTDPALRPIVEALIGRPLEDVVEALAELWPFQFGLADEARALLPVIG
jgi:hypothetical protein